MMATSAPGLTAVFRVEIRCHSMAIHWVMVLPTSGMISPFLTMSQCYDRYYSNTPIVA
jgi:hypothetical protein